MNINSFREIKNPADISIYKEKMGEKVYMRCLYVVEEIERTKTAAIFLKRIILKPLES